MTNTDLQRITIAFFGPSAAGKTTLVSTYYGLQQRHTYEKIHGYRLAALDARDGNALLKNYYGMQDGRFPQATVIRAHTYRFELKLSGLPNPAFQIDWLDYPGGWWESDPEDAQERERRQQTILGLLNAQVGFLLLDGAEYRNEGSAYLKRSLDHFKNEVRKWQDEVRKTQGLRLPVIEEWVIALTKSDLFGDDFTAETFCRRVIADAHEQLDGLGATLYGSEEGSQEKLPIKSFGTRFLLLSSAQVDPADRNRVRSVENPLGLELITPAAFASILDRIAKVHGSQNLKQHLPWWQRALLSVANIVTEGRLERAVGRRYQPLLLLLRAVGALVKFDGQQRSAELRAEQRRLAKEGKMMEAAVTAMQSELESEHAQRCFYQSQYGAS